MPQKRIHGFPLVSEDFEITNAKVFKDGAYHDLIDVIDDPQTDALAGLSPTADTVPYFTSPTTASVTGLTAFARTLIDDASAGAALTTLGVSAYAQTILDDASASAARATLGLTAYYPTANTAAAINTAIAAAYAAGGGVVFLAKGTWTIDTAIVLKSFVQVVGEGWGTQLLVSAATAVTQAAGSQVYAGAFGNLAIVADTGAAGSTVFGLTSVQASRFGDMIIDGFDTGKFLSIQSAAVSSPDTTPLATANTIFNKWHNITVYGIATAFDLFGHYGGTPTASPANSSNVPDIVITQNVYREITIYDLSTKGINIKGACDTEVFEDILLYGNTNGVVFFDIASDAVYTGNNYCNSHMFRNMVVSAPGLTSGTVVRTGWTFGNRWDIEHDIDPAGGLTFYSMTNSQSHYILQKSSGAVSSSNTLLETHEKNVYHGLTDGIKEAPAIGFTSDRDTGLYLSSTGVLGVTAGGAARAYFSSSGVTIPMSHYITYQDTDASHNVLFGFGSNLTANRTVTITTGDADRNLNLAAIDGAWTSYTPTITAASGTITTASATGEYRTVGKTTQIQMKIDITTNGTGAGSVNATLPNTSTNAAQLNGRETAVSGSVVTGQISAGGTNTTIVNYNGGYPGADGAVIVVNGTYENN